MQLGKKQELFARLVPRLIDKAHELGYNVRLGEVLRPRWVAAVNANFGVGSKGSVHCDKLALDLLLFKSGKYLTRTSSYKKLGEWWKKQHPLTRWGGDFGDGNHFSISHRGVA